MEELKNMIKSSGLRKGMMATNRTQHRFKGAHHPHPPPPPPAKRGGDHSEKSEVKVETFLKPDDSEINSGQEFMLGFSSVMSYLCDPIWTAAHQAYSRMVKDNLKNGKMLYLQM